jgi:hypothetical protein
MQPNLLQNGMTQGKRPRGVRALRMLGGIDPEREELGGEIACARRLQVQVTAQERVAKAPAIVEKTLRRVGVAVDDEGGLVNRERLGGEFGHELSR